MYTTGADPGFLEGWLKFTKGYLLILPDYLLIFPDFPKKSP